MHKRIDSFERPLVQKDKKHKQTLKSLLTELKEEVEALQKKDNFTHLLSYKKMGPLIAEVRKLAKKKYDTFERCVKEFGISKREVNEAEAAYRVLKRYDKIKDLPFAISKLTSIKLGQMLCSDNPDVRICAEELLHTKKLEYGSLSIALNGNTPTQVKRFLDKITRDHSGRIQQSIFEPSLKELKILLKELDKIKKKGFFGTLITEAKQFRDLTQTIQEKFHYLKDDIF